MSEQESISAVIGTEQGVMDALQELGTLICETFPHTMFFLFLGRFTEDGKPFRANYISNGKRDDVVNTMKEFINEHAERGSFNKHQPLKLSHDVVDGESSMVIVFASEEEATHVSKTLLEPTTKTDAARKTQDENPELVRFLKEAEGWLCECGDYCDPFNSAWRWTGRAWEHSHGYPIGHVEAKRDVKPILKLSPELGDGDHWTVCDNERGLLESVRSWYDSLGKDVGEEFKVEVVEMTQAEIDALPEL